MCPRIGRPRRVRGARGHQRPQPRGGVQERREADTFAASRPWPDPRIKGHPRDVRGFAVKFYTTEGNWDLVGITFPCSSFRMQSVSRPGPRGKAGGRQGYPQAASAHDTFWDFVGLMPERPTCCCVDERPHFHARSARLRLWSSYLPAGQRGESRPRQVHWKPVLGLQSTCWDEAVKISAPTPISTAATVRGDRARRLPAMEPRHPGVRRGIRRGAAL